MGPVVGGVDLRLLVAAKRSGAYRRIRSRLVQVCPSDSWYEDELAFIAFDLNSAVDDLTPNATMNPQAVFVVSAETQQRVLGATIVASASDGGVDVVAHLGGAVGCVTV